MIRLAQTQSERLAVYAFRYEVYVREMGRAEPSADHVSRLLTDELDQDGYVFTAHAGDGAIVGTARVNLAREGCPKSYERWYEMSRFAPLHPQRTAIVTKLMVARKARGSRAAVALANACYSFGLEQQIRLCFIDCNAQLVSFFESLGFQHYIGSFQHPVYGTVFPMVLDVHNCEHLTRTSSPFGMVLAGFHGRQAATAPSTVQAGR